LASPLDIFSAEVISSPVSSELVIRRSLLGAASVRSEANLLLGADVLRILWYRNFTETLS
jgi:hypothetical protein